VRITLLHHGVSFERPVRGEEILSKEKTRIPGFEALKTRELEMPHLHIRTKEAKVALPESMV